ncbi:MAG: EAL domain-containing protein [Lachnospiraceae bacterium]|nr:EAL domain-containing protein [Lachnospiraceae bacterium]
MERYEYSKEKREFLESAPVPFAIYQFIDKRVVTLIISQGFMDLLGYTDRAQAYYDMDHNMYKDTHPDDVGRIADAAIRFATAGSHYETIYRHKLRDESQYKIIHAMGQHFETENGIQLAQVWYTDEGIYTSEESMADEYNMRLNKALHKESLLKASYYDHLTGLPSMTYFFELAEAGCKSIMANGGKPAFLFLDLSGMKFFNHKHGFAQGDTLLRSFSKLLISYFSVENCSRFGQDHFAVYTEETGLEEKLYDLFRDWQSTNNNKSLSIRVGVYLNRTEDVDISIACDAAKLACDKLRNTYVSAISYYDKALQEDVDKQHYIVTNLDQALLKGWIQVYYQPIVRATNGHVCDEEALARWVDPVRGFLSPGSFIPILEEAKLIYKLDLYIVDEIIKKIKLTQKAGLHVVPQSVNLSRADFDACDIVSEICKRVDRAGISHDLITIEITESIVASNFEFMKKQVERFRKLGFRVWMDDFGSGYSSLDVLESLDFDLIKFDMRFVQQLEQGENGKIILTELMRMATALGLETVCEGVEKKEHVEFLREIGCAKLQGYFYEKPIPVEQIFDKYEKGNQIGFENPAEAGYYETIGRINLYDLAVLANESKGPLSKYFNNLPMAIMEIKDNKLHIVRSNQSYRDYMKRVTGESIPEDYFELSSIGEDKVQYFINSVNEAEEEGNPLLIDEKVPNGSTVHTFIRKVATNPITGAIAVAIVVLAITDDSAGVTYANIARSLASDYVHLFYVDIETDEFIQYSSTKGKSTIAVERHGTDFFRAARAEAETILYSEDVERFKYYFIKDEILKTIDNEGLFGLTYRMNSENGPVYVVMKATRMENDENHLIIGVSNVDKQMRVKESRDKSFYEELFYNRLSALNDKYICIYSVDIATERYIECSSSDLYDSFGISETGENFFELGPKDEKNLIYPEDREHFKKVFSKDKILDAIARAGVFEFRYRLLIDGKTENVLMRGVKVNEWDGDKLIMGVTRV